MTDKPKQPELSLLEALPPGAQKVLQDLANAMSDEKVLAVQDANLTMWAQFLHLLIGKGVVTKADIEQEIHKVEASALQMKTRAPIVSQAVFDMALSLRNALHLDGSKGKKPS